jgi:hypothetical protein
MYVVVEALQAGQHKIIYCKVLRVRKMRYYFKNYWPPLLRVTEGTKIVSAFGTETNRILCKGIAIFMLL